MCPDQGNQSKIDLHTHIVPETWPDWNREFGNNIWVTIKHGPDGAHLINPDGSVFRKIAPNCWCPKTRLEECDRTGVKTQVYFNHILYVDYDRSCLRCLA